ncbi:TPM domain-containing protein [Candidatus Moduliflexota bacterium]
MILALILLSPPPVSALTFPEKPPDTDWLVDEAGLLEAEDKESVNELSSALFRDERIPLYVVTIRSLAGHDAAGYSIEGYSADLFDHWGIGFKDRNYGMLLLVSSGDRRARIELGDGWGRNHDRLAKETMDTLILPSFREGNFSNGILEGVRGMNAMARGLALPKPKAPWWLLPAVIVGAFFLGLLIYNLFKTGRKGWAWALIIAIGVALFFILRNAGRASGSSSGFGGGFSGGGGASGSW